MKRPRLKGRNGGGDGGRGGCGGRRWRAVIAVCAAVTLGLVVAVQGCGGVDQPDPVNGGSKGPEMNSSVTQGPRAPGASQMSQTMPGSTAAAPPSPMADGRCAQGMGCAGTSGCTGVCDPNTSLITLCASCDNTTFTDCTQRACNP